MGDEEETKADPIIEPTPVQSPAPVESEIEKTEAPAETAAEKEEMQIEPAIESTTEIPAKAEEVQIEKIGNKTIEKKGDTVAITEVMDPPKSEVSRVTLDTVTKFPAPFVQKNLWQKFLDKIGERKRKKLDKILNYLDKKTLRHGSGQVTNDEVEKLLHVSDATATRYLDSLEKEGKLKQVGKTGRHTYYEKV